MTAVAHGLLGAPQTVALNYPPKARFGALPECSMKPQDVKIGQRFRKRDKTAHVWQVVAIGAVHDPIVHIRLVREGEPTDTKVISVVALIDPRYYGLET
jgi:hypothetical protein